MNETNTTANTNTQEVQEVPTLLNQNNSIVNISEQLQVYGSILFASFVILATVNFIMKSTSNN